MEEEEAENEGEEPSGGYNLEFLDKEPTFSVCPICTCVARNPLQATCCGKIFCSSCLIALNSIERPHQRHKTCPNCRKQPMGHCYPDRNSDRLIKDLRVKCANHQNGCEWRGELRSIRVHLRSCVHALVACPNRCGQRLPRHTISEHIANSCTERRHICTDCGLEDTYSHITTNHYFTCLNASLVCTNEGCEATFKRGEQPEHLAVCPKQVLMCPYSTVGCSACMRREELDNHKQEHVEHHLAMAAQRISEQDQVLYCQQKELRQLGRYSQVVLRMSKFSERENAHEWWHSPHFYTSLSGYRMSISATMVGEYLSVYLCLVQGEYDDLLAWPLRGTFTITLLNQLEDTHHHSMNLTYSNPDRTQSNIRVMAGRGGGYGFPHFIMRSQLRPNHSMNCQYLKDNAVFFSVTVSNINTSAEKKWLSSPITYSYR